MTNTGLAELEMMQAHNENKPAGVVELENKFNNKTIDYNPFTLIGSTEAGAGMDEIFKKAKHNQLERKIYQLELLNKPYEVVKDAQGYMLEIKEVPADATTKATAPLNSTSDTIEPIEEAGAVEICHDTAIKETTELPMPTHCLNDKKYCAKEYAGLMAISNRGSYETHRYLYKNKFNTAELAKDLGIGRTQLERNIKKLEKLNYNILDIESSQQGIIYKLHYGAIKEDGDINKFVTINHQMLKTLACTFNSNSIKLYCLLRYMTNETEFKVMDNKWLAEQIGLSSKSKNNLDTITEIVTQLELCGFIETKKQNIFRWDDKKGREVPQITKSYRLRTLEEWQNIQNKVKNKF